MTLCRTSERRTFSRRWRWGLWAALVCLSPGVANAAEPSPTELAVARRLFAEAVELERAERWQLAALKLRDAIVIKDTPGLRFHLGHCEDKQGHLVEAMLSYERARELIAAGAKAPDVEEVLEPTRATLERRMPYLILVTPLELPQIKVDVDGVTLARSVLGRPAPLNPGVHHIVARAEGYRDYVEDLPIQEGERRTVHINLRPREDAGAAVKSNTKRAGSAGQESGREAPNDSSSSARTVVVIAESAFTLAALGVGVTFWVIRNTESDEAEKAMSAVDNHPGGTTGCAGASSDPELQTQCARLRQTISSYHSATNIAVAGFIGAGVGAAATVLTYALWPDAPVSPKLEHTAKMSWLGISGRF